MYLPPRLFSLLCPEASSHSEKALRSPHPSEGLHSLCCSLSFFLLHLTPGETSFLLFKKGLSLEGLCVRQPEAPWGLPRAPPPPQAGQSAGPFSSSPREDLASPRHWVWCARSWERVCW